MCACVCDCRFAVCVTQLIDCTVLWPVLLVQELTVRVSPVSAVTMSPGSPVGIQKFYPVARVSSWSCVCRCVYLATRVCDLGCSLKTICDYPRDVCVCVCDCTCLRFVLIMHCTVCCCP